MVTNTIITDSRTKVNLQHMIFSPKYRRNVLNGNVANTCEIRIREICEKKNIKLHEIAIQGDHVHVFIEIHHTMSIAKAAQLIKWYSSQHMRRTHPLLKTQVHKEHLWQVNYFCRSVGGDVNRVKKYIRDQMHHIETRSKS